jgi:hypothetical protein
MSLDYSILDQQRVAPNYKLQNKVPEFEYVEYAQISVKAPLICGLPPIKWRANLSSGCRFECFGFELDWAYIA